MDPFAHVPESQRGELMKHMESQMVKNGILTYNRLTETCFDKCVMTEWGGGFSSKQLTDTESKCVSSCSEKFLKLTQRVGFRFAEHQAIEGQQQK